MKELHEFLKQAAMVPFQEGEWDCGLYPANWIRFWKGTDPAASIRGTYHNSFGWKRILIREGGFEALVERLATRVGMKKIDEAIEGDVGLATAIRSDRRPVAVGAICTGKAWSMKLNKGIVMGRPKIICAWGFR